MNYKPKVEQLEDRFLLSSNIIDIWSPGYTVDLANRPQLFGGWKDVTQPGGPHTEQIGDLIPLAGGGLDFVTQSQYVDANGFYVRAYSEPVQLTTATVAGASVTCAYMATGLWTATWQVGTQIFSTNSQDGASWTTPVVILDTATVKPVAGDVAGLAPLNGDLVPGSVVNTGPLIQYINVQPSDQPAQFRLVIDVSWQVLATGQVLAAEVQSDDGVTFDPAHTLAVDAAFAYPTTFLNMSQAQNW